MLFAKILAIFNINETGARGWTDTFPCDCATWLGGPAHPYGKRGLQLQVAPRCETEPTTAWGSLPQCRTTLTVRQAFLMSTSIYLQRMEFTPSLQPMGSSPPESKSSPFFSRTALRISLKGSNYQPYILLLQAKYGSFNPRRFSGGG